MVAIIEQLVFVYAFSLSKMSFQVQPFSDNALTRLFDIYNWIQSSSCKMFLWLNDVVLNMPCTFIPYSYSYHN